MRVRGGFLAASIAALLLGALVSGDEAAAAPATGEKASLRAKLRRPVSCDFDEVPFTEVVEYFRNILDINIVYDSESVEAGEKPITLRLTDMPARSVLSWAVKLAGLEYTVAGNAVYIASHERLRYTGAAYFRQYPVSDLLTPLAETRGDEEDDDNDTNRGDNNDDDEDEDRSPRQRAARELMTLVVLFTGGPGNWDHVEIMDGSARDEDESESEEDSF